MPMSACISTNRTRARGCWAGVSGRGGARVMPSGLGGLSVVSVHNFSYGLLNPALAYAVSCLGAFLGLRCVTRARAHTGSGRARWLVLAAVAIGATGIWTMHFIAMLG